MSTEAAVNTFIEGLDRDTAISKYSNKKYYDANNMRLFTGDGVSYGNIENEKGNVASFNFPDNSGYYILDTTPGTYTGTITINGNAIAGTTNVDNLASWLINGYPSFVGDEGEVLNYTYKLGDTIKFIQKNSKVVIYGSTCTVTVGANSGTGTVTRTPLPWVDLAPVGYCNMRNNLIIFATDKANVSATPSGTIGTIWKIQYDSNDDVVDILGGNLDVDDHLLFAGTMNLSLANKMEATSFYINSEHGKVYFTDEYNPLRSLDVLDINSRATKVSDLDVIPSIELSKPIITDVLPGGTLMSGKVQYAYQLYDKYGAETIISPISSSVNLSSSGDGNPNTKRFLGSPPDENTFKAVSVTVPLIDPNFDYIRLFSIHFEDENISPRINILVDKKVRNSDSITIIDDGANYIGTITLQELRNFERILFSAKTLATKDNRLICANIEEKIFDVDYDARVFRWNVGGTHFYSDSARTGFGQVGEYDDCERGTYPTYAYQEGTISGATQGVIGGEGENIAYEFDTADMVIDVGNQSMRYCSASKTLQEWSSDLDSSFADNNYYSNYASAINSGQLVGYKRGENYRFGIVFLNSKGQRTPVKWIGDIRFPDSTEISDTVTTTEEESGRILRSPMIDSGQAYYNQEDNEEGRNLVVSVAAATHTYALEYNSITLSFDVQVKASDLSDDYGTEVKSYFGEIETEVRKAFGNNVLCSMVTDSSNNGFYILLEAAKYKDPDTSFVITNNTLDKGPSAFDFTRDRDYEQSTKVSITGDPLTYTDTTGKIVARILYPKFIVTNIPTDDYGVTCSYEIVRAVRDESNKTRVAQGLFLPTEDKEDKRYPIRGLVGESQYLGSAAKTGQVSILEADPAINFISPEVNFRDVDVRQGDWVKLTRVSGEKIGLSGSVGGSVDNNVHSYKFQTSVPIDQSPIVIDDVGIITIEDDVNSDPVNNIIGDYTFVNIINGDTSKKWATSLAGTSMFLDMDSSLIVTDAAFDDWFAFGDITRVLANQYGGETYFARSNTEYTGCGQYSDGSDETISYATFGGDTYVAMFDYLRIPWVDSDYAEKKKDSDNMTQVLFFPVETSVNLDYRYDEYYSKKIRHNKAEARYIQEKAGDYSNRVGSPEKFNYTQDYDLYLENRAYTRPNDAIKYLPRSLDFTETSLKDSRIVISEEYNYNIRTDNLVKFLPENKKDINSIYGQINSIVNHKDNVFIFQDRAIGIQYVNERSLINDKTGATLVLGTGDILGQHYYMTTSSGSKHRDSIVSADSGLYYFDVNTRSFNMLSKDDAKVSSVLGLYSYFKSNVDKNLADTPMLGYGVHAVYDEEDSRIIFTYLDGGSDFTLSYSEQLKVFESFYDFKPYIYIKTYDNKILSLDPSELSDVYLHGNGDYGTYYGTLYDSNVTLLFNDKPEINKVFNNIEFNSRVTVLSPTTATDTYYNETINKIQFYNDYQDSGLLTLVQDGSGSVEPASSLEIKRRNRKWRLAIPRDNDPDSTRSTRFSSTYLFEKFNFLNNNDKKFILEDIITYYIPAIY
jgi:hypothetical protein